MPRTTKKSPSQKLKPTTRAKPAARRARRVLVLVATRKGAWLFHDDTKRKTWRVDGPHFLGQIINHLVLDPRDGRTLLAAAKTGHLGPTIFRSMDMGRTWKEAARPPAFAKAPDGPDTKLPGRVVNHTFWLTPCHANEPNVWYAGTSPRALKGRSDSSLITLNQSVRITRILNIGDKMQSLRPTDSVQLVQALSGG